MQTEMAVEELVGGGDQGCRASQAEWGWGEGSAWGSS